MEFTITAPEFAEDEEVIHKAVGELHEKREYSGRIPVFKLVPKVKNGILANVDNILATTVYSDESGELVLFVGTQKVGIIVNGHYTPLLVPVWLYGLYRADTNQLLLRGSINGEEVHLLTTGKEFMDKIVELIIESVEKHITQFSRGGV